MKIGTKRKKLNTGKEFRLNLVIAIILGLVLIPMVAQAAGGTRPISDFVSQQGTFCLDDGREGCKLFVPPVANFFGWDNIKDDNNPPPMELIRLASVDYAGLANKKVEELSEGRISFGTTTDGTINERRLSDGRAEVTVLLHTRNALTWVVRPITVDNDFASGTLLFGSRVPDVLNGAKPALGESFLQIVFINTAPGADLPDLYQLFNSPLPGQERPSFISIRVQADGELRNAFGVLDGTPGRVSIVQTGLFMTKFKGATEDAFPAELVNINVVGGSRQ